MAKRFTDTEKWKDEWFMNLSPALKLAWFYIWDNCDHAGVWKVNFGLMIFQLKIDLTEEEFRTTFSGRLVPLPGNKLFMPGFIVEQYGMPHHNLEAELRELAKSVGKNGKAKTNPVLKSVVARLQAEAILARSSFPNETFPAPPQPLLSPSRGAKDKEEDKGQVMVMEQDQYKDEFQRSVVVNDASKRLIDVWNANCGDLAKTLGIYSERLDKVHRALESCSDFVVWEKGVRQVAASDWCNGKSERSSGWKATFDWFIEEGTLTEVLEGKFDNRKRAEPALLDPATYQYE